MSRSLRAPAAWGERMERTSPGQRCANDTGRAVTGRGSAMGDDFRAGVSRLATASPAIHMCQATRVLPTFDDPDSAFPEQRRALLAAVMTLRRRAARATAPPMPTHTTSGGRSANVGKTPAAVAGRHRPDRPPIDPLTWPYRDRFIIESERRSGDESRARSGPSGCDGEGAEILRVDRLDQTFTRAQRIPTL